MNNLTLLTYTNSNVQDIHHLYFARLQKYFQALKKQLTLTDIDIKSTECFLYPNEQPYFEQMINALDVVSTDFVLYSQEDYILYDYVDTDNLHLCIDVLSNDPQIGFVRLIQSGIDGCTNYNEQFICLNPDHQYFFSTQATIWKKNVLVDVLKKSKVKSIRDEPYNSAFLKSTKKQGLCTRGRGKDRGGHFDSVIYPYIATALIGGRWNLSEYKQELAEVFNEFNINKDLRGER